MSVGAGFEIKSLCTVSTQLLCNNPCILEIYVVLIVNEKLLDG